jgi:hypothetical protein
VLFLDLHDPAAVTIALALEEEGRWDRGGVAEAVGDQKPRHIKKYTWASGSATWCSALLAGLNPAASENVLTTPPPGRFLVAIVQREGIYLWDVEIRDPKLFPSLN